MKDKKQGYVYILTNPAFKEDWVKIGKSSRPVDVRSKELDNTAIPVPFEIFATMRTAKYSEAEKLIHRFIETFTNLRIRDNREFFNVKPEKALEIFKQVAMVLDDAVIEETYKSSLFETYKKCNSVGKKHCNAKTPARVEIKKWMIPANPKYFNVDGFFQSHEEIYWRQNFNFQTGDFIYIYVSSPDCALKYKCLVERHDLPYTSDIEADREFYINPDDFETIRSHNRFVRLKLLEKTNSKNMTLVHLLEHGMKSAPQGCLNLSHEGFSELLKYIEDNF